jgi:hypothetical protein
MIAAALHDYGSLLRVTATQRTPRLLRGLALLTAALWAAAAVAGLAGLLKDMAPTPGALLRQLVCAAALALIVAWATVFMPGSMLVHSAASARMLPRQRRRLFQLAFGSWVLPNAALALSMGEWTLFLIAGTVSLAVGLLYSGRPAGAVLMAAGLGAVVPLSFLPKPVSAALGSSAGLQALGALLLAVGWLALRTHYPAEGSERMRRRTVTEPLGQVGDARPGGLGWCGTAAVLRRAVRSRDPETLLAHGIGPAFHWAAAALVPAGVLALVLIAWAVMAWWDAVPSKDFAGGAISGVIGAAAFGIASQGSKLRRQLAARRGEGALLRLAPRIGDAATLNRRLANAMLKSAVLVWLLTTAIYLSVSGAAGATPRQLETVLAMCCIGGQFALSQLLDDLARGPVRWMDRRITTIGLIAAEFVVTVGVGALAGFSGWRWLAVLCVAATAIDMRTGRRRLLAAPPALPVGRCD